MTPATATDEARPGEPGPAPRQRSCAVVVLGAGRSGTSAVTRGLAALGVDLGDRLRSGGAKNPTGFFEDRDLLRLNRRLKRALGIRGDSVRLVAPDEWRQPRVEALRREAEATVRRRFGGVPLWGYKYGRTLRLLPFWEAVYRALDLDVRYVVAVRNPLSVARSRGRLDPRRGAQEKSDLEWLVNVVPYFAAVRDRPFVVVDYDRLMADPAGELARVGRAIELPPREGAERGIEAYARSFLDAGRRHTRFGLADLEADAAVHPLVRDAYRWLHRLACDEVGPQDPALWRDWERIEREVQALAPLLHYIDRVEAELRRARRNPLGPLQLVPQLWRRLWRG